MSGPTLHPWTPDRTLTLADARAAIEEAVPELAPARVVALGEGWDFEAFAVNDRWVFRFPKRDNEQERFERELHALELIGDRLGVPVPHYRWKNLQASAFPYGFGGYARLDGVQAISLDASAVDLERVGTQLGRALGRLHAIPLEQVRRSIPHLPDATAGPAQQRERMGKVLKPVGATLPPEVAARAWTFFEEAKIPPAVEPSALVHDDLHFEHLLLDAEPPHAVCGILDWSDVAIGDPANDFACLYAWGGEPLLRAMVAAHPRADAALAERARFIGRCQGFQDLHYYLEAPGFNAWGARLAAAMPALFP